MSAYSQFAGPPQGYNPNTNNSNMSNNSNMGGSGTNSFFNGLDSGVMGQVVSSELLNTWGQDMISKQKERWLPGASWLWSTLKIYFSVNNAFVFSKMQLVLAPMRPPAGGWQRRNADDSYSSPEVRGMWDITPIMINYA